MTHSEIKTRLLEEIEEHIRGLKWSEDTPDIHKTLVAGNIRGFASKWIRRIEELEDTLGFYARHEHWMSLTEDGDCSNLIAHGPHFDGTSNGWVEAEASLAK